ncbi:hypothetical protein D8M21_10920 [Kocuria sp. HSID16901]|nr:hypothetical protein D8M21_10920 [Kocuria sp. HSID16901]
MRKVQTMLFHDPIDRLGDGVKALRGQTVDLGRVERGPFFDPLIVSGDRVPELWIGEIRRGKAEGGHHGE